MRILVAVVVFALAGCAFQSHFPVQVENATDEAKDATLTIASESGSVAFTHTWHLAAHAHGEVVQATIPAGTYVITGTAGSLTKRTTESLGDGVYGVSMGIEPGKITIGVGFR
jgi:hypothetical protein